MSFQAVRAVFEEPVIDALAALSTPVPCYVDNQAFTVPDAGQEYATINLQFGQTTSKVLTGNLERLRGSLVVECYTSKNTGPARAQEMITPVMKALNDLNSCSGYKATGAVGWVGDMTGPAFFALDDAPFYMVRVSVAVAAKYEEPFNPSTGKVTINVGGTFTQGQSTQTGLVSTPTTRFQIGACDSWCLSGKGYTSTWEITPPMPWGYVNACMIQICPTGPDFSIYSCLYDPSGALVQCDGDKVGSTYSPTPFFRLTLA